MKRTVSLVLAAALVLGSIPAGFAATAGETLKGYGVVAGDTNGNLNEDKTITRAEMMTVLARLLGKFEEASKYSIPSTSKDVAGHWNANVIAFAEKEGWTAGKGNGMFDPQGVVTLQETAAFMLKALGYTITDYAKVVEEATAKGLLKDVVAKELTAPVKRSDVFTSALNTLNTPSKDATVKLGEKLGYFKSEALTVGEIKANAANSFQVKFNKAVDPTKVAFAVKRENTAATVTTTWNTEKTMATLTYASKMPEGNYEVTVNDTTTADKPVVMATQKIVIEKEKIAKVEVASETLLRYSEKEGYVPYKVINQYGEDVTNGTLGRSISVVQTLGTGATKSVTLNKESGIAIFKYEDGVTKLRNLPSVVLTLQYPTAGFVFTKTLKVSETANAIAEVKINGIVNEKGEKVDFVYSLAKAYYLDITVLDTNGQEIKSKEVLDSDESSVKILQVRASNGTNIQLAAGNTLELKDAPGKTDVAAWPIKLTTAPTFDTPVVFTAIAPFGTTGKNNATFTTTLKRAARVEKFTLLAPAEIATQNKTVELFFEAFDQNGEKVTAYDDLVDNLVFTPNSVSETVKFVRQADGSAKLFATLPNEQLYYVTATVKNSLTGAFSQVAIDVKAKSDQARVEALAHTKLYTQNAYWEVGADKFIVKDKYNRTINLNVDNDGLNYYVKVVSKNSAIVSVNDSEVFGGETVTFKGGSTVGTTTIEYTLMDSKGTASLADDVVASSTVSAIVYNIADKDVKSIALAPSADPIYMLQKDTTKKFYNGGATALGLVQDNDLGLVGKNKDGAEVRLDLDKVTFKSTHPGFTPGEAFLADRDFGTATTASTVASAQYNNSLDILTATATVNASADKPVASSIAVSANAKMRREGDMNFSNNVLTIKADKFNTYFVGKSLYKYNKDNGAKSAATAPIYFNASSQYGDYLVDRVDVIRNIGSGFGVNLETGVITTGVADGDQYTITASTENGKKIVITVNIDGAGTPAATALAAAEAAVVAYEKLNTAATTAAAGVDALIANGGTAAQAAINNVTDAAARAALQARFVVVKNAADTFAAAITNAVDKAKASDGTGAGLGSALVADYAAINVIVTAANLPAVNLAIKAAAADPTKVDTAKEIEAIAKTVADGAVSDAAAKLAAAQTAVATVESYRDLAIATTTKANIDAFKAVYNTADTKVQGLPAGAEKTALENKLTAAKTAVATDAEFATAYVVSVTAADPTHLQVAISGGTPVTDFANFNITQSATHSAVLTITSATGLVAVATPAAAGQTGVVTVTVTDKFWTTAAGTITVDVTDAGAFTIN